jgi:hypothetical protein
MKHGKVDLDMITELGKDKHGVIPKEELLKIRNMKFSGKQSKLPSVIARSMAQKMFDNPDTGTWIDTSIFDADKKKLVVSAFKKDFQRIAKAAEGEGKVEEPLRIKTIDQGNKVSFFYETRRKKDDENGPVKDKTDEAKKKKKKKKMK